MCWFWKVTDTFIGKGIKRVTRNLILKFLYVTTHQCYKYICETQEQISDIPVNMYPKRNENTERKQVQNEIKKK